MMLRSLQSRTLPFALLLALVGCPGDDGTAEGGADSGASSTTTEPSTGSTSEPNPTSTTEPATGSTSEPGPTSTTEPDTGDSTADSDTGPSPVGCGDLECTAEQWCDYSDNVCGAKGSDGSTSCEPLPEGCGDIYAPVCGCDGQVHGNDCDANSIGVDVDAEGDCETPSGYFRCGYRFCSLEFEFCQIQYSDIVGYGHSYACVSPAQECPGGITCDCLGEELCFEFGCEETPDGGIEIGCPGG